MIVGTPKEIKNHEYRVGLTPESVFELTAHGHEVLIETGGHRDVGVLDRRARLVLDLKCPGSGESEKNHWANLDGLREGDELKFVVADREDYLWARRQIAERRLAGRCPILFSPVHDSLEPATLARWVMDDGLAVRVQLQLHKLLWPGVEKGV